MSIYDREYIRVGPRSKSGLGSLRFISFNSWIILLNILVFGIDVATRTMPMPVRVAETYYREVDDAYAKGNQTTDNIRRDAAGTPLPDRVPLVVRDRAGNVFMDPEGRSAPNPAFEAGGDFYVLYGDKRTPGDVVVSRHFVMMSPVQAYGHLSTWFGIYRFEMWRYITFQFLHANLTHIFFNMFGLWIFGGMVEQYRLEEHTSELQS